ncbi:MAG: DUF998 domain-containing protein [Saprospiraceae bacterium]|nr:DUF998 domain-containing protein [Saprospiraceae bacterium]
MKVKDNVHNDVSESPDQMLISYMLLRRLVGTIGVMLPLLLLIGCCVYCGDCIQPSISAYYNTLLRDIFVGALCSIAVFLFCYRGYDARDNFVSNWAGFSALGVAFFGTDMEGEALSLSGILHYSCATSFFIALTYFSLFLFTKTNASKEITTMKLIRNNVYRVCGYAMISFLVLIIIYKVWLGKQFPVLSTYNLVFWLETFTLWAFGVSWMIKGEMVLVDK